MRLKLPHLNDYCASRRNAARYYNNGFKSNPNIVTPVTEKCGAICDTCNCHVFHQYTIQVAAEKRDALKEHLGELGIPSMIYYPVPVQDQEAFADLIRKPVSLDITVKLSGTVLSLPMHTELDEEQLAYICGAIRAFFE